MRILWLMPISTKYNKEIASQFGYGGGWIESLQTMLENSDAIEQLGIIFSHPSDSQKFVKEKVIYYPIKKGKPANFISRIIINWINKVNYIDEIKAVDSLIKDFNPDAIHVFGTESWPCHAIRITNIPSVVHLQGLLLPCLNAYLPVGFSKYDLIKSNWKEFIKGRGAWHNLRLLEKKSQFEYQSFKEISFYMGRTDWDESITGFLSPKSRYFHVDEVLRDIFYETMPWKYNKSDRIIITSTLSDTIYKGLDLVIKTAKILLKEGAQFEWRIIGVNEDSMTSSLFIKKLNLNYSFLNVHFLGIKKANEIVQLLSETTIYVHTSYIDNSPNSLCEAQLMGVPVIATGVGGVPSLIENEVTGFLVPSNDPYFLASKINQIYNNKFDLSKISKQTRESAQKGHSKKDILNQVLKIYDYLISVNTSQLQS